MTVIDPSARRPTVGQDVAVARIEYALAEPGGVAVLCGPAGAGVSTVLQVVWQRCASWLRPRRRQRLQLLLRRRRRA